MIQISPTYCKFHGLCVLMVRVLGFWIWRLTLVVIPLHLLIREEICHVEVFRTKTFWSLISGAFHLKQNIFSWLLKKGFPSFGSAVAWTQILITWTLVIRLEGSQCLDSSHRSCLGCQNDVGNHFFPFSQPVGKACVYCQWCWLSPQTSCLTPSQLLSTCWAPQLASRGPAFVYTLLSACSLLLIFIQQCSLEITMFHL